MDLGEFNVLILGVWWRGLWFIVSGSLMSGLGDWVILIYFGIFVFSNVYGGGLIMVLVFMV